MPVSDKPPPATMHAVLFRENRGAEWRELFASPDAEEAWRWSIEFGTSGHYRYVERPAYLFEHPTREEPDR